MGFSPDVSISAVTVFMQGLLSFFSPCVLPLLPLYIGYLSGGTATRTEDGKMSYSRGKVLTGTLFFVLGISFAFFVLGLGMTAIGMFFGSNQYLFARIGGIFVILLGLYQLGLFGNSDVLSRERRLPFHFESMAMSPLTALLMGFVFSFAWTPCVGPALSGVLLLAASASSKATGFLLIGVYTLGFVIPFLAVGLFTTSLLELFNRHRDIVRYTVKVGGVLLLFMGFIMLTGTMNGVTGYLARISQPHGNQEEASAQTDAEETQAGDEEAKTGNGEAGDETGRSESGSGNADAKEKTGSDKNESGGQELMPAVDFELTDQYGTAHRLSDYKGKTVFLNFWATWCPPCRAEMPAIQNLYEKYQVNGDGEVVILGVAGPNFGEEMDAEGIKGFLEENGYTYPVVMDETGSLFGQYYITAFPTTFMIDRDGNVFGYVPGSMTEDMMERIIDQTVRGW
ncbi:MAG: redoxin domain-containing protein [Lachnospiraceae bacterium]|nr:redoxin domain-containing protein [Lachnospiraceae bacterium]